jgi:hypothetical protein
MSKFNQQMIEIFDRYSTEVDRSPTALDDVAEWAVLNGLYSPNLKTIVQLCREDMAESLRHDKRTDAAGHSYRAKIAVRQSIGGNQISLWSDADLAPRVFFEKSISQRRRQISGDCHQLKQDVDHFNYARQPEHPIQLILDFTDDVAELEASKKAA